MRKRPYDDIMESFSLLDDVQEDLTNLRKFYTKYVHYGCAGRYDDIWHKDEEAMEIFSKFWRTHEDFQGKVKQLNWSLDRVRTNL